MTDNQILDKLHSLELEMLHEVDRICKENDIQYFLAAGTLIGAVRHNGFIPWDDDIDLEMTRENFDKFEAIANQQLNKKFFFQTPITDPQCGSFCCGRVRYEGTHFKSNTLPGNWQHDGIFIDILPLDKIKKNKISQFLYFYRFQILVRVYWLRKGYKPNPKNKLFKFIMKLMYILFFPIPTNYLYKKLLNYHKKTLKYNGNIYTDILSDSMEHSIHYQEEISDIINIKFEDSDFPCPIGYDSILKRYYGNYMELPPEEERVAHHINDIDFGIF